MDFRAVSPWRVVEAHGAAGPDGCAFDRLPGDDLARPILGHLHVPGALAPAWPARDPAARPLPGHLHRLEVVYEAGEVGEVAPEGVDLLPRSRDGDRPRDGERGWATPEPEPGHEPALVGDPVGDGRGRPGRQESPQRAPPQDSEC